MGSGIDPKVDYAFKRLFGGEDNALLLVDLLNAVVGFVAGKVVRGVELLNPFVDKDYAAGKVSILDVRARDDPGRQFLLEMQLFAHPGFVNRLLFYWAGGHAEQLLKGERYELLQPTYALCFVNERLFADDVYHHRFRVYDERHGVLLCRDLEVHLLELSKFDLPVEQVKTPLERWCYFFKHGATLEPATLPATLDVPVIRKAVEVLVSVSQTELERQRYLERQRVERDAASLAASYKAVAADLKAAAADLKAAQEEARLARQAGFDEGREKGIEKGKRIGGIQLLQQLLKQAETSSEELGRMSEQNLLELEESLKRQFNGRKDANGAPPPGKS